MDHLGVVFSTEGNIDKVQKMKSKPCNNDFQAISDEAKKNAHVRYYFENNLSQW